MGEIDFVRSFFLPFPNLKFNHILTILLFLQPETQAMKASFDEEEAQLALTIESSKILFERAGKNNTEDKKSIIKCVLARFSTLR